MFHVEITSETFPIGHSSLFGMHLLGLILKKTPSRTGWSPSGECSSVQLTGLWQIDEPREQKPRWGRMRWKENIQLLHVHETQQTGTLHTTQDIKYRCWCLILFAFQYNLWGQAHGITSLKKKTHMELQWLTSRSNKNSRLHFSQFHQLANGPGLIWQYL